MLANAALGDGLPPGSVIGDTFTVIAGQREAGSALIGQHAEAGGAAWTGVGKPVIAPGGCVTVADSNPAMGLLGLPEPGAAINLSADLHPAGGGFLALALLPDRSPDRFWQTAAVYVLLTASGDYEIRAHGDVTLIKHGVSADYPFRAGDFNHVELWCAPASKTVSVRINGTVILPDTVVSDLPQLVSAAFRFNEGTAPGSATLDNFALSPIPVAPRPDAWATGLMH
jgi:hypothetical protein